MTGSPWSIEGTNGDDTAYWVALPLGPLAAAELEWTIESHLTRVMLRPATTARQPRAMVQQRAEQASQSDSLPSSRESADARLPVPWAWTEH